MKKEINIRQRKFIEDILPFYESDNVKDRKVIRTLTRILKIGKYTPKDAIVLNDLRDAHQFGLFERGISDVVMQERFNKYYVFRSQKK